MAFGRSFPEALQKAMRSLEKKGSSFSWDFTESLDELMEKIATPTQDRLIQVQRALALGASIEEVFDKCAIDPWFLSQIDEINRKAVEIKSAGELSLELLKSAKQMGFSDQQIGQLRSTSASEILKIRERLGLFPVS